MTLTTCQKLTNAEFLRPLADQMTNNTPEERPTAVEARAQWLEIRKTIFAVSKEWRPRPRREGILDIVLWDVLCLYNVFKRFAHTIVRELWRW